MVQFLRTTLGVGILDRADSTTTSARVSISKLAFFSRTIVVRYSNLESKPEAQFSMSSCLIGMMNQPGLGVRRWFDM
jgi:hypothetical protein